MTHSVSPLPRAEAPESKAKRAERLPERRLHTDDAPPVRGCQGSCTRPPGKGESHGCQGLGGSSGRPRGSPPPASGDSRGPAHPRADLPPQRTFQNLPHVCVVILGQDQDHLWWRQKERGRNQWVSRFSERADARPSRPPTQRLGVSGVSAARASLSRRSGGAPGVHRSTRTWGLFPPCKLALLPK